MSELWSRLQTQEAYLPVDLTQVTVWASVILVVFLFVVGRYLLFVGLSVFVLHSKWAQKTLARRKIYRDLPRMSQQLFELRWSMATAVIFAVAGLVLGWLWQMGWTQLEVSFSAFPWWYQLVVAPALLVFLHETWFYWTHRWLHQPRVYRRYHAIHHESLEPSAWASFSFHPVESLIQAVILPLIVMVVPLHPLHVLVHLTVMTLSAISNHSGYELLPRFLVKGKIAQHLISGTHHSQHHRYFKYNFGLFLSLWDRWMRTEHPDFRRDLERRTLS